MKALLRTPDGREILCEYRVLSGGMFDYEVLMPRGWVRMTETVFQHHCIMEMD